MLTLIQFLKMHFPRRAARLRNMKFSRKGSFVPRVGRISFHLLCTAHQSSDCPSSAGERLLSLGKEQVSTEPPGFSAVTMNGSLDDGFLSPFSTRGMGTIPQTMKCSDISPTHGEKLLPEYS